MLNINNCLVFCAMIICSSVVVDAQDWPNLERYRAENAALPMVKSGEKRVVFMGNSITEGWKRHRPDFFIDNPFVCRGISGQTTPQMLLRFRQDVVALNPTAVVILAGTNDIAGNTGPASLDMIMDNIKSMTEIALQNNIKVVHCSVLPAYDFPWRPGQEPAPKVTQLNDMLKAYSQSVDAVFVDYHTTMKDDRDGLKLSYGADGIHPNADGYKVMEGLVLKGIAKAMSK